MGSDTLSGHPQLFQAIRHLPSQLSTLLFQIHRRMPCHWRLESERLSESEIKRIDTKVVYKNRWMTVSEDRVRRPNGDHGLFGVVDKPDFSLVIPFDGQNIILVQQYHYPVDGRFWEFPQGALELDPDATPEQVATAELRHKTGLESTSMVKLG